MQRRRMIRYGVFLCAALAAVGCDKVFPKQKPAAQKAQALAVPFKGTLIARVNGLPITLDDLNGEVAAYNASVQKTNPAEQITTREQRIAYLEQDMVQRALLYQEALDRGLDRNEDVAKAFQKFREELLVAKLVRDETMKVEVTPKDIEDYYNTYKDELKEPEERRLREIMVPGEQEAKDVLILLLQGGDFAALAKERSKAPSAVQAGDTGFIARGKRSVQYDSVAFSDTLEAGKTSGVFNGGDGYYILKLEEKRGGTQKTLSVLWDDIKKALTYLKQQQQMRSMLDKLRKAARVETFPQEIK